jgi:hypothetical protein
MLLSQSICSRRQSRDLARPHPLAFVELISATAERRRQTREKLAVITTTLRSQARNFMLLISVKIGQEIEMIS